MAVTDITEERPPERYCASCKMRWRIGTPQLTEYSGLFLPRRSGFMLANAARTFDELSEGRLFTAEEFVAWLMPDLRERGA